MDKRIKNFIGQRFGKLIVVGYAYSKFRNAYWVCKCDCGNTKIIPGRNLGNGHTKSCGCLQKETVSKRTKVNIRGHRFGRLTVINESGRYDSNRSILWRCFCDCGNSVIVSGTSLRKGLIKSCGCLMKEINSARFKGENNPLWRGGISKDKEYVKEWCQKNKKKRNQQRKVWRKNNTDKVKCQKANRRALKNNADGFYELEDLKYIYYHQQRKCARCRKIVSFKKITVDHIEPLSWGGSNWPSNIQLLCRSCNSIKKNYHAKDYRDYIPLFL